MELDKNNYDRILANLREGLYFVDKNRIIFEWNNAAETISGFSSEEVIGNACSKNILTHVDAEGNQLCLGRCPLSKTMEDLQPREAEVFLHHKDGHRVPVLVRTTPLIDSIGNVVGGIEIFTDISAIKANELRVQELEQLALLDRLTQLANRYYLDRELTQRYDEFLRYKTPFGLIFMDIDFFKRFNDTYGHETGDKVLRFLAKTIVENSRPFDLFGRWGGEEFLGVLKNIPGTQLENIANRFRKLIENSYLIENGEKLKVTVSMGATIVKESDTLEVLLKRVDSLLYRSKQQGRNQVTFG